MTESGKLKPYPFCGCEDLDYWNSTEHETLGMAVVQCELCSSIGPAGKTWAEAMELWNTHVER